ncbi:putative BTB/POZ domain-containing protein-like [Capsicum annuum]|nr:putative BTB/POZ domain-containing protein-like [Capsicum annuum]
MGLRQTIDGRIIKKELVYGGNSPFALGPHGSYLESRSAMGDASVSSFSSVESNRQPLNEPFLDADTTSFGFLGEMPQNFGFLDLTADFANSSGTCLPLPSFFVISWHLWILCSSAFKVLGINMRWYDANQA